MSDDNSVGGSEQLTELAETWHEHADFLYESENRRMQGMARGYRSCAEELERLIE